MGYIKINLDDELLERFKREVFRRFGYYRGAISIGGREAIKAWLERGKKESNVKKDFEAMRRIVLKNFSRIKNEHEEFRKKFRLRG